MSFMSTVWGATFSSFSYGPRRFQRHMVPRAVSGQPSPPSADHFGGDVVTRGTTFLSARDVIHSVQPGLKVQGFAAIRTMSFDVVETPVDPVRGTITVVSDERWGWREP